MTTRREFITLLGGAAVGWPLAARAEQKSMAVVGFLSPGPPAQVDAFDAVRQGLREAGFVERQNVAMELRFADGHFDRLGVAASVAAKAATTTIPVAFYMGEDPVSLGLVPSLNRPSGNLTGVATLSSAVMAKRLEQLHELAPRAGIFAALINPKNPYAAISTKEAKDAARALGKDIEIVHAGSDDELEPAFATLSQAKAGALLIAPDGLFIFRAAQVAALALRYAIPASHERRAFPDAGGLMSYGASQTDGMRLAGSLGGRILKGEKPADLPVLRATKFEFVINLKTAKALGLEVPPTLLALADEVIE